MWMDHEGLKWGWGERKDESGELIGRGALLADIWAGPDRLLACPLRWEQAW